MINIFVGEKISERRRKLSLNQEELAERAKISVETVCRIENNRVIMKLDTMFGICFALETTPNELFGIETVCGSKSCSIKQRYLKVIEVVNEP